MARALSATVLAAAALLVASASSAIAGTYTVEACTPGNTPGDAVVQPVVTSNFNAGFFRCGNMFGGGIRVGAGANGLNGGPIRGGAGWRVVAPPDTTIDELEMERIFEFVGANGMRWRVFKSGILSIEVAFADGTTPPSSGGVIYQVHAPEVAARFECPTSLGCNGELGTSTAVTSKNFFIRLSDALPPTVTLPPPAERLRGMVTLPYEAVDRGAGVGTSALLSLDFVPVQGGKTVAADRDENGGKCREPFKVFVPCKLQLASSFSLDTTSIPDGQHTLTVLIADAAGNVTVGDTVPIVVDNAPGPGSGGPGEPQADRIAPVLSDLSLSRKRLRRGATTLRFASDEAATLSVAVARAPKMKTSKRPKPLVTLTRTIGAGSGQLKLNARRGRKPLRPGRYTVSVSARDGAGNLSKESRLSFTILPG